MLKLAVQKADTRFALNNSHKGCFSDSGMALAVSQKSADTYCGPTPTPTPTPGF
jgi:hypothetical protein